MHNFCELTLWNGSSKILLDPSYNRDDFIRCATVTPQTTRLICPSSCFSWWGGGLCSEAPLALYSYASRKCARFVSTSGEHFRYLRQVREDGRLFLIQGVPSYHHHRRYCQALKVTEWERNRNGFTWRRKNIPTCCCMYIHIWAGPLIMLFSMWVYHLSTFVKDKRIHLLSIIRFSINFLATGPLVS